MVSFPTISGMPIKLPESDFTSDSTWPPDEATCPMCVCLFVQCTNMHSLGTKQHRTTLKMWFPTIFGMAILVMEADLTENSKWLPGMSNGSNVFTCFNFGTKQRRNKLKVSFPTKFVMAFLFMQSDLTSDSRWLQSTMSNVQTCFGYLSHRVEKKINRAIWILHMVDWQSSWSYQIPLTEWASQP